MWPRNSTTWSNRDRATSSMQGQSVPAGQIPQGQILEGQLSREATRGQEKTRRVCVGLWLRIQLQPRGAARTHVQITLAVSSLLRRRLWQRIDRWLVHA